MNTSEVEPIVRLIAEYGVLVVIAAVFILLFVFLFKFLIKQFGEMFESYKKQNETYFQALIKPQAEPQILEDHLQVNEMVERQLRKLRDETDSDRTFIYMFHNTDHGIGGFPFLKASCFYEWSLATVRSLLGKQRDIPVFLLADALKELGKGKPFIINDITLAKTEYQALAAYMTEVDSRSTVLYPLKSSNTGVIGFLGIDFTHIPIEAEIEKELVDYVAESALVIQSILDLSKGGNSNAQ